MHQKYRLRTQDQHEVLEVLGKPALTRPNVWAKMPRVASWSTIS
ncbi:MAG: hypothetical protein ACRDQH_04485 [Pseudonocardiaceae bacterium]